MAFQFPLNPVVGQVFNPTPGVIYKWDGFGWAPFSEKLLTVAEADARYLQASNLWSVGDIYLSMSSANPSVKFGGTWALISQGRFLVGANGGLGGAGAQGGEYAHTLTQAELPSFNLTGNTAGQNENPDHSHPFTDTYHDGAASAPSIATQSGGGYGINPTGHGSQTGVANTNHSHGITIHSGGSSQPHNVTPPYLACYMWQKTA